MTLIPKSPEGRFLPGASLPLAVTVVGGSGPAYLCQFDDGTRILATNIEQTNEPIPPGRVVIVSRHQEDAWYFAEKFDTDEPQGD